MNDSSSPSSRIDLPPAGSAVGLCCFYAIFSAIAAVAIYYLVHFRTTPGITLLASLAWLSLVALVVWSAIADEGGIIQYLVNRLGYVSKRQFVEADTNAEHRPQICFGYEVFGHKFYYLQVETSAVEYVRWHSGQGTALSGRDMDDWSVVLWYYHPNGPRYPKSFGLGRSDVHTVGGPSGPKERTEAFGRLFVAFLQSAGVALEATDDPCKFVVKKDPPEDATTE